MGSLRNPFFQKSKLVLWNQRAAHGRRKASGYTRIFLLQEHSICGKIRDDECCMRPKDEVNLSSPIVIGASALYPCQSWLG